MQGLTSASQIFLQLLYNVSVGLLSASLISFFVLWSILEGRPVLGNVPVVPHFSKIVDDGLLLVFGKFF